MSLCIWVGVVCVVVWSGWMGYGKVNVGAGWDGGWTGWYMGLVSEWYMGLVSGRVGGMKQGQ